MNTATRPVVVTLVHGTFAPEAAWCSDDSPFVLALAGEIGGDITVRRFVWSGINSHEARWQAASELRQHLESEVVDAPDADHFIVAHSHGGNVVRRCIADESIGARIKGVVFLATPFLSCDPRDIHQTLGLLPWLWLPFLFTLVVVVVSIATLTPFVFLVDPYDPPGWATMGRLGATFGVVAWPLWLGILLTACTITSFLHFRWIKTGIVHQTTTRWESRQRALLDRYEIPMIGEAGPNVLSLSAPLDSSTSASQADRLRRSGRQSGFRFTMAFATVCMPTHGLRSRLQRGCRGPARRQESRRFGPRPERLRAALWVSSARADIRSENRRCPESRGASH